MKRIHTVLYGVYTTLRLCDTLPNKECDEMMIELIHVLLIPSAQTFFLPLSNIIWKYYDDWAFQPVVLVLSAV
jgi:hypothetical protein